jgi:thioredoxin 1
MALLELTDQNFKDEIAKHEGYVLVDFWAEWCGPCKALKPVLESIADEYKAKNIIIASMDVQTHMETATEFMIRALPTLMLFKNGDVVDTKMGALSEPDLRAWLDNLA